MTELTGLLLDTVSIQKYIFASSRLKENIGASYIVNRIYADELAISLQEVFGGEADINEWREHLDKVKIAESEEIRYEVAYIGGGNALLLFRNADDAKRLVQHWSKRLLKTAPGIRTAVAIGNINLHHFREDLSSLYHMLIENKNKCFPNTTLHRYGITAEDPANGLSAEIFHEEYGERAGYISSVSKTKLDAADAAQRQMEGKFRDILSNKFTFTREIAKLGQQKGDSYIAIVHIDGNNIGELFQNCKTLSERRILSKTMSMLMEKAFSKLLQEIIIHHMPYLLQENSGFRITQSNEGKTILPIRPLVLGGDDMTFVTDGRLGLYFAQKIIEYLKEESMNCPDFFPKPFSACAGVVLTRTKYPFFRGYELAEELCGSAKQCAREEPDSSWLDFHLAYGGFSGEFDAMRERHYTLDGGEKLYFGPYIIDHSPREKSIKNLKKGIRHFRKNWPHSKVKELRSMLASGKDMTTAFIKDQQVKGGTLPSLEGPVDYTLSGWENNTTPYFDMIELLDFYPDYFLDWGEAQVENVTNPGEIKVTDTARFR